MKAMLRGKINNENISTKVDFEELPCDGDQIEVAYWKNGESLFLQTRVKQTIWISGGSKHARGLHGFSNNYYPLIEFDSVQTSHSLVWHLFNWILKKIN